MRSNDKNLSIKIKFFSQVKMWLLLPFTFILMTYCESERYDANDVTLKAIQENMLQTVGPAVSELYGVLQRSLRKIEGFNSKYGPLIMNKEHFSPGIDENRRYLAAFELFENQNYFEDLGLYKFPSVKNLFFELTTYTEPKTHKNETSSSSSSDPNPKKKLFYPDPFMFIMEATATLIEFQDYLEKTRDFCSSKISSRPSPFVVAFIKKCGNAKTEPLPYQRDPEVVEKCRDYCSGHTPQERYPTYATSYLTIRIETCVHQCYMLTTCTPV